MENRKKFALAMFFLMMSGLIFAFLPAAEGATAMTDIPKTTYFKYRCPSNAPYSVSLDMTFTDNSTTVYKVTFNYTANLGTSEEYANGTAYIKMSNRTVLVSYWNGTLNLFPNGTETIFYIEPKLKATSANFNANFIGNSSMLTEGAFDIYHAAKYYNPFLDRTFENAIHANNISRGRVNAVNDTRYHITSAIFDYYGGINLYQSIYDFNNVTNAWNIDLYLYKTNYDFYETPASAARLNLTNTIITIALVFVGLVALVAGCRRK